MRKMLDSQTFRAYKWQAPDALVMQGWRSNQVRSSPAMAKPYFRSNYAEVKTKFDGPFDNCVCIPLTQGHHTLVDTEDFEAVIKDYYWYANGSVEKGIYVRRGARVGKNLTRLHKMLMNAIDFQVDHINGNTFDNRKSNLRSCNHAQNQWNRRLKKKEGYKGVTWNKSSKKWLVQIKVNGARNYLGCYKDKEKAALVYDSFAIKYYGEFAKLNFPPSAQ